MSDIPPRRRPTIAEAFFRQAFGCVGAIVFKIIAIVVIVLIIDWRQTARRERREAERAAASEQAARLADEFAKETDDDGRYVRRPEGELPEIDPWGRPFRLSYHDYTIRDGLQVRSAGPDGEWKSLDDVVARRFATVATKATARDAAGGVIDAARKRLFGGKKPDDEPKE